MMLKEKSNPWARLKYLYVLPLAAIAVTAFARPEITEKVEEISVVKVTDLTENVQEKVLQDTVKASKREKKAVAVYETKAKQQPLVIVDGKETTVEAMHALDPSTIESISVLKDSASMEIYRGCGANGAIVVTLKKEGQSAKSQANAVPDFRVSGTVAGEQGSAKVGVTGGIKGINAVFVNGVKGTPLYIVDGKEVTNESLSKIEQNRIKSISILKDESTTSTYGERGKNGVIFVELLTDEEYEARQNKK